jgi:hypothetical protein
LDSLVEVLEGLGDGLRRPRVLLHLFLDGGDGLADAAEPDGIAL